MAKFDKKYDGPPKATACPPPEFCQIAGCENKTGVAFMQVFNKDTGHREIGGVGGAVNEVGGRRGSYAYISNNQLVMGDKYDFRGWVTRCGNCYQIDLMGQGKRAIDNCKAHAKIIKDQYDREESKRLEAEKINQLEADESSEAVPS